MSTETPTPTTTPTTTTPTATTTPAPAPAAAPAPGSWYESGVADPELREFVKNKGWDGLETTVRSYRSLEKMVGASPDQVLRLPREGDVAAERAMYQRLGMPESPDKYNIPTVQGLPTDEQYIAGARTKFHELGLSAKQAEQLVAWNNEFVQQKLTQQAEEYNKTADLEDQALKREWRDGYDKNKAIAAHAVDTLGFTADIIDGIEDKIGYAATLKLLHGLGTKLGEDSFVNEAGRAAGFGGLRSPEDARQEWTRLKLDPQFMAALMSKDNAGHKDAVAKQTQLFSLMYPEG